MIDLQALKEHTDLLALALRDTALRKVASTGGGEWAGACPWCGGRDRFRVEPYAPGGGRWLCRGCTDGKWQDAIAYVERRDGLDFKQACEMLGATWQPRRTLQRPVRTRIPAYDAPVKEWQALARETMQACERRLWGAEGAKALDYLRRRGLQDETIKHFRLGYYPKDEHIASGIWIDRGIVIPCQAAGEIWYLKVRRPSGKPKYRCMTGSRPAAIFGAEQLPRADHALFVEGEFDAMIAWQELGEVLPACTMGSATNRIDLATWGPYLMGLRAMLVCYDMDQAGEKGLAAILDLSERVKLAPLPEGNWKDVNDYFLAGGDLWDWILPYLEAYTQPALITSAEQLQALEMGAESITQQIYQMLAENWNVPQAEAGD